MTKRLLLFVIISVILFSCREKKGQTYARLLTYKVKLEILDESIPESGKEYLNQKYGDSVEIRYDRFGNIRLDHFGSGEMGMEYSFYNADRHKNYSKWKNFDTIYYYDTSINKFRLDSMIRINVPNGFLIRNYSDNPYDHRGIYQEFYFLNDSLTVNEDLYKGFNDFSFGEVIANSQSLPIKTTLIAEGVKTTRTLFRVQIIDDPNINLFTPDEKYPLKEF